jgi:hypothetical protein
MTAAVWRNRTPDAKHKTWTSKTNEDGKKKMEKEMGILPLTPYGWVQIKNRNNSLKNSQFYISSFAEWTLYFKLFRSLSKGNAMNVNTHKYQIGL